jgi:hypothetical protein
MTARDIKERTLTILILREGVRVKSVDLETGERVTKVRVEEVGGRIEEDGRYIYRLCTVRRGLCPRLGSDKRAEGYFPEITLTTRDSGDIMTASQLQMIHGWQQIATGGRNSVMCHVSCSNIEEIIIYIEFINRNNPSQAGSHRTNALQLIQSVRNEKI